MAQITTLKTTIVAKNLNTFLVRAEQLVDASVTPLNSGDNYDMFDIPKGALVHSAGIIVHTVEGAADTIDLGVTGALAQFLNDQSVNALGAAASGADAPFIATADIAVTLLANAAIDVAKLTVFAIYTINNEVEDRGASRVNLN